MSKLEEEILKGYKRGQAGCITVVIIWAVLTILSILYYGIN